MLDKKEKEKAMRTAIQILLWICISSTILLGIFKDISLTKTIIEIFAIVSAAIIALTIYIDFSPKISLRILPVWIDHKNGILKIRTEIENTSKVICIKKRIRFQKLEQRLDSDMINEFVAFDENYISSMKPEPIIFTPAEEINLSTEYLYPGEIISTERVYKINPLFILHVGLQFEAELGFMKYILRFIKDPIERWTTTSIIAVEK